METQTSLSYLPRAKLGLQFKSKKRLKRKKPDKPIVPTQPNGTWSVNSQPIGQTAATIFRMCKKTPRQIARNAGVSFGLVCKRWPSGPGSNRKASFFRENRELARRREDFWRYACGFGRPENLRNRSEFCESGVIPGSKGRNPRIPPIRKTLETPAPDPNHSKSWSCADWTMFLHLSLIGRIRKSPKNVHERG